MCCKNSKNNNSDNKKKNKNNKKNKSGLEQFGNFEAAQKLKYGALTRTYMSFAIAEKPRLPRRTFPLTAMCLLTAFSACDSIHKHPCLTLVMCTRMFAICPSLSRYPQHSALLGDLITLSAYLCCSGPSASVQTCAANTNSSA